MNQPIGSTVSEKSLRLGYDWECRHEWCVVENFYTEISGTERAYAVYCVYCLKSKASIITKIINTKA